MSKEQKDNAPKPSESSKPESQGSIMRLEKAKLPENEPMQCEKCMKDGHFDFYDEGWWLEGVFYCNNHREYAQSIIDQIDQDVARRRQEQEDALKKKQEEGTSGKGYKPYYRE